MDYGCSLYCFTGVSCWERSKEKGSTQSTVGVLSACWLVIRSLAAYNYAKLQRCWVLSLVLCGPPQGQRTYFSLGLSLSVRLHRHRDLEAHGALYLCSEEKLNVLKQFEGFCCCLFCSLRVTLLALNSMEMVLPLLLGAEIKGVRASKPGYGLNFSLTVLQCCSWAGCGDRLNLSIPEAKAGGSL